MSTRSSEQSTRWSDDVRPEEPLCWLTSGEEVFWSEPRACLAAGAVDGPDPSRRLLALNIDPPAIGQAFGLGGADIEMIVVTPVTRHASVDPLSSLPIDVHLLLPQTQWRSATRALGREDLRLIGRGTLVASHAEAEAKDHAMQRMNGPRR